MPTKKKKDEDMKSEDLSSIEPKSKSVWGTLKAISVNDHTEKKNGLTYLSWAWAWGVLKDYYPDATFEKVIQPSGLPYIKDDQGYTYVQVTVTAGNDIVTELFPVTNYANKPIQNPNSFDVNTAHQRCLAKAIAYLGLGHYIYAGEDMPQDSPSEAVSAPVKAPVVKREPSTEFPSISGPDGVPVKGTGWSMVSESFKMIASKSQHTQITTATWSWGMRSFKTL